MKRKYHFSFLEGMSNEHGLCFDMRFDSVENCNKGDSLSSIGVTFWLVFFTSVLKHESKREP